MKNSVVLDEVLKHYGVKGMKWGVRNEDASGGGIGGLEHFPPEHQKALVSVSQKMDAAYGVKMTNFIPITDPVEASQFFAHTRIGDKGYTGSLAVHVRNDQRIKDELLFAEKVKWAVPSGNRPIEALITHESGHVVLHATNKNNMSYMHRRSAKPFMTNEVRDRAWGKASQQALKDGVIKPRTDLTVPPLAVQMAENISGYAGRTRILQESEAEMFTAYHWSPKPPKYVDTFMNEVHGSMGKQVPPFSGRKVSN